MKKFLRKCMNPETARGLAYAMALTLLLSSILAPLAPVVEASTASNYNDAVQRAAAQPLEPLDPMDGATDDGTDAPPAENGGELPPADDGQDVPPTDGNDGTNDGGGNAEEEFNDPAQINITLHWCSLNANIPGAPDGNALLNDCENQGPGAQINLISNSGSSSPLQANVTLFPGTVNFTHLENDLWRLDIQSAPYTVEALFCDGYLYVDGNQRSNTKPYGSAFRSQTSTPAFELQTQNNEVITCDWFGQMPNTGMLALTKWNCPEGFDLAASTYTIAKEACTSPVTGPVGFEVAVSENNANYLKQQETQPASMNTLLFNDVPTGTAKVSERVPEAYELGGVFCSLTDWSNPNNSSQQPEPYAISDSNTWEYKSSPFTLTSCDVFNIASGNDQVDPNVPEDSYGHISITKLNCSQAPPPASESDISWWDANCQDLRPGVPFTLSNGMPDQTVTGVTSDQPNPGRLEAENLRVGGWSITEDAEPGTQLGTAFCMDETTGAFTQYAVEDNGITLDLKSDQRLQCAFLNVPYDDATDDVAGYGVYIDKYLCAMMPDESNNTYEWYRDNCTQPQDGVHFGLWKSLEGVVNGGPTSSGTVQLYDGAPTPGDYEIRENTYEEFEPVAAFCRAVGSDGPIGEYMRYDINSGAISVSFFGDHGMDCVWFNYQADPMMDPHQDGYGDLQLHKYVCTTLPDPSADYSWYTMNCTTTQDGVQFTLGVTDPPSGIATATNDIGTAPGYIQIGGVSTGTYPLTETMYPGYSPSAVFCGYSDAQSMPGDSDYSMYPLTEYAIDVEIRANQLIHCKWFNVQLENEESSVTLYKWECPEGSMYGQEHGYYSAACDTEHAGVPFQISDDNGTRDFLSDTNGHQEDGLLGSLTIREMGLPGYGDPVVYCQLLNDNESTLYTSTGGIVVLPPAMGDDYQCFWYNIPEPESTVVIYKWECPEGMPAEHTSEWFTTNCVTPMEVDFTLTDINGPRMQPSTGGVVQWTDVATGAVQITEHIPSGYTQQPFLVCYVLAPNGMAGDSFNPVTVNGTWNTMIEEPGSEIICNWYNWYLGNGEITVYKFTCPEGYDRTAWGADPMVDCTTATNGISFMLDQPDPGVDLYTDTGDSINGAVYFGGLTPGNYTLTEMVNMGDFKDIFVWQCVGLNSSAVHPVPLSVGPELNFIITGGDNIVCYWFNVPYPQYGTMVVHKFNCSTEKYVSDVHCYTNQTGQYFDLQQWNGSTWSTVQSGTTDVSGKVTFTNLDSGDYRLIEPDKQACLMKSSNITPGGNIGVNVGETTTVHVFNCKVMPPDPKKPGKYPNTGVAPSADESAPVSTPGIALAGLAGLMGMAMSRRKVVAGAGLVTAGAAATALPLLSAQELVPMDSTPAPGTPAPEDFFCATPTAATPGASTPVVDPCNRGPIPTHMRIPEIGVDAPIEYLEIIDGAMQQPTGDTHIAWYKETSRLGEIGNGIYAAHVNWYGNPEGIFFRLESLQQGDVIEIDGEDSKTHLFEVQWAQDFPSDEEPPEEALGLTDEVAITLITCGGEWSSALSEYDHRTLVRAVLRE